MLSEALLASGALVAISSKKRCQRFLVGVARQNQAGLFQPQEFSVSHQQVPMAPGYVQYCGDFTWRFFVPCRKQEPLGPILQTLKGDQPKIHSDLQHKNHFPLGS